jgi:NAD(P)H-hydrate epimerase
MSLILPRDVVRELDRRAVEEYAVPSLLLMENAGRACADVALDMLGYRGALDRATAVVCGPGNNGGDGLVIARTLVNRGYEVRVLALGGAEALERASEDVRANLAMWLALGEQVIAIDPEDAYASTTRGLGDAALVVDALFGTGLTRPLEGPWEAVVAAVNDHSSMVLAVDVPSGLDADTGEVLGCAVRALGTVTFVAEKPGLHLAEGPEHARSIQVVEIGIPGPLMRQLERA